MKAKIFLYPIIIKEIYLDLYGHVNNAVYMTLFEEARWDFINKNGYGLDKIKETGLGPVILEANIRFQKELKVRENVVIESQMLSYENKIAKLQQLMIREKEVCCTAEFTFGLFDIRQRKLALPTPLWLKAVGMES